MRAKAVAAPSPAGSRLAVLTDERHTVQRLAVSFCAPRGVSGAALELLCSLLERGTRSRPSAREHAAAKAEMYGLSSGWHVRRRGDSFRLVFGATFVSPAEAGGERYAAELERFLAESVREPAFMDEGFDEGLFEVDRSNLASWLRELETQPSARAVRRAFELALEGDPYSRPASGTPEEAEALELAGLRELFARTAWRGRALGVSAGPLGTEEAGRLLLAVTGGEPRGRGTRWRPFEPPERKRRFREEGGGESDHVVVFFAPERGARFTRTEFAAAMGVFATGSSSRIFRSIREEMGIAYGHELIRSFEKRIAAVHSAVLPGRGEDAAARIEREMEEAGRGVDAEELAVLKRESAANVLKRLDSPGGLAEMLLYHLETGGKAEGFDGEAPLRRMERVRPERAARVLSYFRAFAVYVSAAGGEGSVSER